MRKQTEKETRKTAKRKERSILVSKAFPTDRDDRKGQAGGEGETTVVPRWEGLSCLESGLITVGIRMVYVSFIAGRNELAAALVATKAARLQRPRNPPEAFIQLESRLISLRDFAR